MITDLLILLLMFDTASTGYIVKCPDPSQWRPRATSFCDSQLSYVCLLNLLTKHYQEECTGIDYSNIGSKLVFQPVFNLAYCNANRYQPFPFTTHGNTECIYSKSKCHGEGQLVFKNGNESSDTTCLCDYKRRYSFVTQPKNKCFCIPIEEDCSCYRVRCHKLSADYKCIRQDEMFLKNTCEEITRHMQNNKTSTMTNNVLIIQSAVGLSYPDLTIIKIAITVVIAITLTVISLCIMQTFYFEDKKNVMKSKQHFRELILNDKRIKHNYVRVMFIGKHGVGKTSLMRRLLWTKKKDIQKQKSTDGIDISKCIINMQDGKWKPCDGIIIHARNFKGYTHESDIEWIARCLE